MTFEAFMRHAEEALRLDDLELARSSYWAATRIEPGNPMARMRLGLVLKRLGRHQDALDEFTTVTRLLPEYGEAWKEKGVVEGLIARRIPVESRPAWLHDGQASLERATLLIPDDFDAWSSLGGVLKNVKGDPERALQHYRHAAEISEGHPYPLLNALRLEAQQNGKLEIEAQRAKLEAAEALRRGQMETSPPTDAPWCFFDVAEIRAYLGDEEGFLQTLRRGLEHVSAADQPRTFRNSLTGLLEKGIPLPGMDGALGMLDAKIGSLEG